EFGQNAAQLEETPVFIKLTYRPDISHQPFGKLFCLAPRQRETETERKVEPQHIPVSTALEQYLRILGELAHHINTPPKIMREQFLQPRNPALRFARRSYFALTAQAGSKPLREESPLLQEILHITVLRGVDNFRHLYDWQRPWRITTEQAG